MLNLQKLILADSNDVLECNLVGQLLSEPHSLQLPQYVAG